MTTYHLFAACIGSYDDDASYRSIPIDTHVFFVGLVQETPLHLTMMAKTVAAF
jgi:hypothetical protein